MMAGEDRPSPRELSQALMKGDDGKASARNLTVLFAFFGKFLTIYSICSINGKRFVISIQYNLNKIPFWMNLANK